MRPFILIWTLLIAVAANGAESDSPSLSKYARQIDARITRAHRPAKLSRTFKELSTGTDGGGELVLWASGAPYSMDVSIGLSNRMVDRTFYYVEGTLVLLVEVNRFYKYDAKAGTLDLTKFGQEEETRYYFRDDKLVYRRTPRNGKAGGAGKAVEGNPAMAAKQSKILSDSEYFLKAARSKEKIVDVASYITGDGK